MKKTAFPLLVAAVIGAGAPLSFAAPKPTPAPTPAPAASAAPVPRDATGWNTPRPPYPEEAKKEKLSGKVQVTVRTDRLGKVTKAKIKVSSGHKELDDATVKFALSNWTGPAFSSAVFLQNYTYKK